MPTKAYTIYRLDDPNCPDGKMKKADGPAIQKALRDRKLTPNDIWDCDEQRLLNRLREKGVIK